MSIWARQVRAKFPGAEDGTPEYVEPLLNVNLLFELVTAAGIFLLVRRGVRRSSGATDSGLLHRLAASRERLGLRFGRGQRGLARTLAHPRRPRLATMGLSGFCHFIFFAALAALTRRWFWCGCLLAVGGMLKGQFLFVAPFFIFWPLWQKRWAARRTSARRFCCDVGVPRFSLAPAKRAGLGGESQRSRSSSLVLFFGFARSRNTWAWAAGLAGVAAFAVGALRQWQLRLVADRFPLRQRALSLPVHQLLLQPPVPSFRLEPVA